LSSFCALTGVDLSKYDLDTPFDFENEELSKAGIQGIFNNFKTVQNDKPWTPRMVGERVGLGGFGPMPVGTPSQVADVMEQWFTEGGIDGFNISYMCNPDSINDLVELLIPELQRRGIFWTDYPAPGGTLRENMQNKPGQPLAGDDHPAAKLRWDKIKAGTQTYENGDAVAPTITSATLSQVDVSKAPVVLETEVLPAAAI